MKRAQYASAYGNPVLAKRILANEEEDDMLEDIMSGDKNWHCITSEIIYLRGVISTKKTDQLIKHILYVNSDMPTMPAINLFIDSVGGDMQAALGLIAVMRASTIKINTIAIGSCSSAALMIAMAGEYRYVDKYCSIMSHIFSTGNGGMLKPEEIDNWLRSVSMARTTMVSHYEDCTGLTSEIITENLLHSKNDVYLTAEEAINYNMFDYLYTEYAEIHANGRDILIEED